MPNVRAFQNLRHLRLCMDDVWTRRECDLEEMHKFPYFGALAKLATLPLTEVQVVLRRRPLSAEVLKDDFSKEDRTDFAEGIRRMLLDPKGADAYAEERQRKQAMNRKRRELEAMRRADFAGSRRP